MTYLFVGEKRSLTAQQHDWTWESGHLAAKTLFAALTACGIAPGACQFVNAYTDSGIVSQQLSQTVHEAQAEGTIIVGMGALAQKALEAIGIPYLRIIHPAARGSIRKQERYHAHIKQTFQGKVS